jgi:spermidine synthase
MEQWRRDIEIFGISVLILYLELVLIRWIGTEIRIFAYLGNLILVVCFFGVGLGCYLAARPVSLTRFAMNLLVLAILVANPLRQEQFNLRYVTDLLAGFEDSPVWAMFTSTGAGIAGALVVMTVLLYLVLFTFVPAGQMLGRAMQAHSGTIRAYSINIGGSLAGVWLFNTLSWLSTPPLVWFVVVPLAIGVILWAQRSRERKVLWVLAATCLVVWCGTLSQSRTVWSPYQKLAVRPVSVGPAERRVPIGHMVEANSTGYQVMVDLSDGFVDAHPEVFDKRQAQLSQYNLTFELKPGRRRVLIVGAGTGNNAAGALRHGVEEIDCVEIDPQIYALGRELHPEQPYDSPRVRMHVDDARAFLRRATGPYDLIWFGLLDTHPGSSSNNRRVDHYVYTMECFQQAKRLLDEDGLLVMNFASRRTWISDRLFGMIREVFGRNPVAFVGEEAPQYGAPGELTLIAGIKPFEASSIPDPVLRAHVEGRRLEFPGTTRPTTDDWPYLYLRQPTIPKLYLVTMLAILGTVALARQRVLGGQRGIDWHFFALGAAFLLLEVQTVSRATLLFGMTWTVNAIVFSAVLVMILASNLVAARWLRLSPWWAAAGLGLTVLGLALVPLDWFNELGGVTKLLAASAFLTAPVFFSGLVFIRSFDECTDKSRALGSNLFGALVGGLLESLSFITGIRALIVLVGLFYAAALARRPSARTDAAPAAA